MPFYSVFGGCLHSDLDLPDLPRSRRRDADWRLTMATRPPPAGPTELIGEHAVGRRIYRLLRADGRWRLTYDGGYVFELGAGGSAITYYAAEGTNEEYARALLLGPVLALAHHLAGALCLHGSAVAVGRQGIAFLGAKHHGKSTLGLALTLAGARQLSDDAVVVDREPVVRVRPGVHSIRLWHDSVARLGVSGLDCMLVEGVKQTLTELPRRLLQRTAVPLAAIYLLTPVRPAQDVPAVERRRLPLTAAAIALTHHTKLAQPLVGLEASGLQFQRAAEVARSTPVFELRIVRDFDRLPGVVPTILGWHRPRGRRSRRALSAA